MTDTSAVSILLPMAAHVGWVVVLYAALTVVRAPDVWGIGRGAGGANPWAHFEPRISANLRNQFEWPMLFYVACLLGICGQGEPDRFFVLSAWVFVAGRIVHSGVQALSGNIRLRGVVFTINFVAVLCMWGVLIA